MILRNDIIDSDDLEFFIKTFKSSFPPILYEFNKVQQELYILFHIVNNLKKDEYYIPNIINILINNLKSANSFLHRNILNVSREYKSLTYKYNIYYDKVALRSDILEIFFLCMFLNTDPIHILNYNDYYYSTFKMICFTYLKNRTEGILNDEDTPTTLIEGDMNVSNRCKIFEDGIKLSQIYHLCHESDTLKRINCNYR